MPHMLRWIGATHEERSFEQWSPLGDGGKCKCSATRLIGPKRPFKFGSWGAELKRKKELHPAAERRLLNEGNLQIRTPRLGSKQKEEEGNSRRGREEGGRPDDEIVVITGRVGRLRGGSR